MSFRFWRRIGILPGVTLNLSKSGGSLSFGPRGAKFTVGSRGRRATVGIPGTGLFYTTVLDGGRASSHSTAASATAGPAERLTLGFFRRLVTSDDEKAFVDGCRELVLGDERRALAALERATHIADGAYLAGFLSLRMERLRQAAGYLSVAAENHGRLGNDFGQYGISATMHLPITDTVAAQVGPDLRGVLLGLVEAYQGLGRPADAIRCLERLRQLEPEDVVVKLSLAELLLEVSPHDREVMQAVVRLAKGIENESAIHAALLFYRARALRGLGLPDAARDTLTSALRRRKDRPVDLLRAIRYERAGVYEDLGRQRRARAELQKLYAEAPDYEDVAVRLGL